MLWFINMILIKKMFMRNEKCKTREKIKFKFFNKNGKTVICRNSHGEKVEIFLDLR